ncbi:hypothetical protein EST38_g1542 [Candolleomyces aberdarensis]|uniref:CHAT domain-containing protein n=1 Tax=Candolleomyces aberdarensis TaxID=2316362 RepID=A0A4Q2DVN0_9AGAR|nr:hypothetical protein EST38_g1542 [Candolleomyces aberdarensis]
MGNSLSGPRSTSDVGVGPSSGGRLAPGPQAYQPASRFEAAGSQSSASGYSYFLTDITLRHAKGELKNVSLVVFGRKEKNKDGEKMKMTRASGTPSSQKQWKLGGEISAIEISGDSTVSEAEDLVIGVHRGDEDEDLGFVQVRLDELRKMGVAGKGLTLDLEGTDDEAAFGQVTISFEVLAIPPDDTPEVPPAELGFGSNVPAPYDTASHDQPQGDNMASYMQSIQSSLLSSPDLDISKILTSLQLSMHATSLLGKARSTHNALQLDEAISTFRSAIQAAGGPGRMHLFLEQTYNNLGLALVESYLHLFQRTGDLKDLEPCMAAQKRCLELTAPNDWGKLSIRGTSLALSYLRRFERTNMLEDVEEAIVWGRKALDAAHKKGKGKNIDILPTCLNTLGLALWRKYERLEKLEDVKEAIGLQKEAISVTESALSPLHPSLPKLYNNLGNSLNSRFKMTDELVDIQEAVSAFQKAVKMTPSWDAELPMWLNNLSNALLRRYRRTWELLDLEEGIKFQLRCVSLTPSGHSWLPSHLNNLGNLYECRFERTGRLEDVEESMKARKRAIEITPKDHGLLPNWYSNLGNSYMKRYMKTGERRDSDAAIEAHRRAIELTPEGQATLPDLLNNLATSHMIRFDYNGMLALSGAGATRLEAGLGEGKGKDLGDVEKAISNNLKAISLTPPDHADMFKWRSSLGVCYQLRFGYTGDEGDLPRAVEQLKLAATSPTGSPLRRLEVARAWVRCAQLYDPDETIAAYDRAVELVNILAGLEQTLKTRHKNLAMVSDLSLEAATAAFSSGRLEKAFEWLEQGRCLVWNQLNSLRTPLEGHPELSERFRRVSKALEKAGSRQSGPVPLSAESNLTANFNAEETTMDERISLQDEAKQHTLLAKEWNDVLDSIRSIPELKNFLRPPSASYLLDHLPQSGPVVVINVHRNRCDALALLLGLDEPIHIPLPNFSFDQAELLRQRMQKSLVTSGLRTRGDSVDTEEDKRGFKPALKTKGGRNVLEDVLKELWLNVVHPILDHLGFHAVEEGEMPRTRIWWCATGPLAFLPVHAAGIYNTTTSGSLLADYAVSSYTPTVTALVDRAKHTGPTEASSRSVNSTSRTKVLLVSVPNAQGLPSIPGTTREIRAIEEQLKGNSNKEPSDVQSKTLERELATTNSVLDSMGQYSCVHFACHAVQNVSDALRSGFFLHDGTLELADIIRKDLRASDDSTTSLDLAFLSACQTSTGDEKLSEEAVHLAAGMLAAGYQGVVATMWSIQDLYAPELAKDFYAGLLGSRSEAAYSLHIATRKLREKLDNSPSSLLSWVPYVHFGL